MGKVSGEVLLLVRLGGLCRAEVKARSVSSQLIEIIDPAKVDACGKNCEDRAKPTVSMSNRCELAADLSMDSRPTQFWLMLRKSDSDR
jgi:hypothetical protein